MCLVLGKRDTKIRVPPRLTHEMLTQRPSIIEWKLFVGQVVNVVAFAFQANHPCHVGHAAIPVPQSIDILRFDNPHVGVTGSGHPGDPVLDQFRVGVDQRWILDLDRHHEVRLQDDQELPCRLLGFQSLGLQRVPEAGLLEHGLQGGELVGVADGCNNRRNIEISDIGGGHAVSLLVGAAVVSNSASRRGSSKVMPSTPSETSRRARLSSRPTPHARTAIP